MSLTKAALREELRRRLAALSASDLAEKSAQICQCLVAEDWFKETKTIALYLALPREPDLSAFVLQAEASGKVLCVPAMETDGTDYRWREYRTDQPLACGPDGVWQPKASAWLDGDAIDVVLVPGLGFTREGQRLGRGGGCYDRLLSNTDARRIGVAFSEQIIENIPSEKHDIQMHKIIFLT